MKKEKIRKKIVGPYAHGATSPVVLEETGERDYGFDSELMFGTTIPGEDYPVRFYGMDNVKKLHAWLGKAINEFEK